MPLVHASKHGALMLEERPRLASLVQANVLTANCSITLGGETLAFGQLRSAL